MWSLSSARVVRFVLAPALSLWIAGAGCLFACESMVAAAAGDPGTSQAQHTGHGQVVKASADTCSSSKSHDCCRKNKANKTNEQPGASRTVIPGRALIASENSSPGGMMRCPLALNGSAVVTKASSKQIAAPVALSPSFLPTESFLEQTASLSRRPLLPNRGHTYLRCCVFLI